MSSPVASLARHYVALGLRPGATRAEIELAFRAAALRTHPDRGGCAGAFAEARVARDALCAALDGHARRDAPWSLDDLGSVRAARSARGAGSSDTRETWNIAASVVLPAVVGVLVAFRLMYVDTGNRAGRTGVRAGGNSRVYVRDNIAPESGRADRRMRQDNATPAAADHKPVASGASPAGGAGIAAALGAPIAEPGAHGSADAAADTSK